MTPKYVSFVMPAFKSLFLKDAIESILAQTFSNFELIIVDDASPEDLYTIISKFNDPRIKYFRNEKNIGGVNLVEQWNYSIKYASGDYIILASDDDLYKPLFLESCIKLTDKYPNVDIIRSKVEIINEHNELVGVDSGLNKWISQLEFIYRYLIGNVFICMANYMFKTEKLKDKGFIDMPHALGTDIVSIIDLSENGIANTNDILFSFRVSSYNLSGNKSIIEDRLAAITKIFEWILKMEFEPNDRHDIYYKSQITYNNLINKCSYDYYNDVLKHMSFIKMLTLLPKCKLATNKHKFLFVIRYIKDHIF